MSQISTLLLSGIVGGKPYASVAYNVWLKQLGIERSSCTKYCKLSVQSNNQ